MSAPASSDAFASFLPQKSPRTLGGILLATLFMVTAMLMVVAPLIDLSLQTYKLTMRNRMRAQARAVAESELDYMFYQFMTQVATGSEPQDTPRLLGDKNIVDYIAAEATDATPTTLRNAFLLTHREAGWRVKRSMQFIHSEFGRIPNTTKIGDFAYVTGRVEVLPPADGPFANAAPLRIGRRFVNSNTSIFQYGVFFEGDLELNPGGSVGSETIVDGDVVANGSVFMAPRSGRILTLKGKIRSEHFNTLDDGTTAALVNPNAPTPIGITFDDPTFFYTKDQQLETLTERENLLGGIDANAAAYDRPDLFGPVGKTDPSTWTAEDLAVAENNVFRSLMVPPPTDAADDEYPNAATTASDYSVIAAQRAYNRAELFVTVEANGSVSIKRNENGTITNLTSTYGDAVLTTTNASTGTTTAITELYDNRESKVVQLTTIDIAKLKTLLEADADFGGKAHGTFNGLLYVNLKNITSSSLAAVRLINATDLPTNSTGTRGFSVVTNGGIYVQGSYNTTSGFTNSDGEARSVPAMLMGDALTVVSNGFDPKDASSSMGDRDASPSDAEKSAAAVAGGGAEALVQINAGLLTGNVPSSTGTSSGGVQNLVRYLEDWTNIDVVYKGSLGRLFGSHWFTASYGVTSSGTVYAPPRKRTFTFDDNLQTLDPPGTPSTTGFNLGVYFTW